MGRPVADTPLEFNAPVASTQEAHTDIHQDGTVVDAAVVIAEYSSIKSQSAIMEYEKGELVWFDPGIGYVLPGEVTEFHRPGQVVTVQAVVAGQPQVFTLTNLSSLKKRQDLGQNGVADMTDIGDLNEASILWNLKIRYDREMIYTYAGSLLISINPYSMFDVYGLDMVKRYEGQILGTLPPHIFAVASAAYDCMLRHRQPQAVLISGESGAGKTESTKLLLQYLAAVNKSQSNLITEQILESVPLLESFGNAKTQRNDNSSRFGKYLEIFFKDGVICGSRTSHLLLEKSRVVSHAAEERSFHIFYQMLTGLSEDEMKRYGLQTADHYFYLNQGDSVQVDGKYDRDEFQSLLSSLQVLGFSTEEQQTIFKILAAVLHLGNIYFHKVPLKSGHESVEMVSDAEVRWVGFLLGLNPQWVQRALISRTTETRGDRTVMPLTQEQALDVRDALARQLYSSLFSWLLQRVNGTAHKSSKKLSISILDLFGFENCQDNGFDQLCVNYCCEMMHQHYIKQNFISEQQEYIREKIEWQHVQHPDNGGVVQLISRKPAGIIHLLDDESNFPKATDTSLLEKLQYNHALNDLYSRPRVAGAMEFGVQHYSGQVWYNVDGFLEKNRDVLRGDLLDLLISSETPMICELFADECRSLLEGGVRSPSAGGRGQGGSGGGRFVTVKPRGPTVAARLHDRLHHLLETVSRCHPWHVVCLRPNTDAVAMRLDMPVLLDQLRNNCLLESVHMRKLGYPVRVEFKQFVDYYRPLYRQQSQMSARSPRIAHHSYRELCRIILENGAAGFSSIDNSNDDYQLGASRVLMRNCFERHLEQQRLHIVSAAALTIQTNVRRYLAAKRYKSILTAVIRVQSWYRMCRARHRYRRVLRGVVQTQALFRMYRQKRRFTEMKGEMLRRVMAERAARQRAAVKNASCSSDRRNAADTDSNSRVVAGVNHLEIPGELAFIFNRIDDWQPVHTDRHLMKLTSAVDPPEERFRLPHDIDYHAFTKFTNIYFKAHLWGMKREPIRTPFLSKSRDSDYQLSLVIFKLILRFMNDNNLTEQREKALADFIVNKGLTNERLRDEILCQLCNQTWMNSNHGNCERGWMLMSNCLSVFPPSDKLYKYLLKYVSDHGQNGFAADCQKKLLRSPPDGRLSRVYPPTLLEWRCNSKKWQMALDVMCADGHTCYTPVDSWTTGEEMAAYVLENRGIGSTFGWTVRMSDGDDLYEMSGTDYVLDVIGEAELPPGVPPSRHTHLTSSQHNIRNARPRYSSGDFGHSLRESSPHRTSGNDTGVDMLDSGGHDRKTSMNISDLYSKPVRSSSQQVRGASDGLPRDGRSPVNGFYGNQRDVQPPTADTSDSRNKSRSLDNLLDSEMQVTTDESSAARRQDSVPSGLSSSKLNERYHSCDVISQAANQRAASTADWNKYGLSESALNGRYFSTKGSPLAADEVSTNGNDVADAGDYNSSHLQNNGNNKTQQQRQQQQQLSDNANRVASSRSGSEGRRMASLSVPTSATSRSDLQQSHMRESGVRSSAMSDTSETPSLASHVRRVRVPSQASDMDQYVDDLFMPVLDSNLDELSDARSLAASIKGGRSLVQSELHAALSLVDLSSRHLPLAGCVKEGLPLVDDTSTPSNYGFVDISELFEIEDPLLEEDLSILMDSKRLSRAIQGGVEPETQSTNQTPGQFVFQPIAGSGMMSPPPMLLPGSVPYMSTPAAFYPPSGDVSAAELDQSHVELLRVTSPSANCATSPVAGAAAYMPVFPGLSLPAMFPSSPMATSDGGPQTSISADAQQMALYQRMFLQSAVAQNMQIQQQLLTQNQALTQLLQVSANQDPLLAPKGSASAPTSHPNSSANPSPGPDKQSPGAGGREFNSQEPEDLSGAASFLDASHSRARTVRIGKWRWPPPQGTLSAATDDFLHFKLRAQQRRINNSANKRRAMSSGHLLTDCSFGSVEWDEFEMNSHDKGRRDSAPESTHIADEPQPDYKLNESRESSVSAGEPDKVVTVAPMQQSSSNGSAANSVSKLKISSALKQKLEAVTSSQQSRPTSSDQPASRDVRPVKKLDASRRLQLERQLVGATGNDDVSKRPDVPQYRRQSSTSGGGGGMGSAPPPAPPLPIAPLHVNIPRHGDFSDSSLSDSSPGQRHRSPPQPIQPIRESRRQLRTNQQLEPDRRSNHSQATHNTDKTEKYELEECDGFLSPVDEYRDPGTERDLARVKTLENTRTRLFPPSSAPYLTYCRTSWTLDIRKEVFSPTEDVTNATALHLVFCQIVQDVFNTACIRISQHERQHMLQYFDELGINEGNIFSTQLKLSLKRRVLEIAKLWQTYFCLLFAVAGDRSCPDVQYVGVSHSGVRLLRREKTLPTDHLRVLQHIQFNSVESVCELRNSGVRLVLSSGVHLEFHTNKAGVLLDVLERFIAESRSGSHEYVRAATDYQSPDPGLLSFNKGDVIRVIRKGEETERGWLFGILDGRRGMFPGQYVIPIGKNTSRSQSKLSTSNVDDVVGSTSPELPTSDWLQRDPPADVINDLPARDPASPSAALTDDGKHSLLQFAMLHFRDADEKYNMLRNEDGDMNGSLKHAETKTKKQKKKSKDDWTWREQVEMVKWSSQPLEVSLLKLETADMNRMSLECFLCIQRYMGDQPMAKTMSEVDCVYSILMSCHRSPALRDEVFCQLMRQTTSNKSHQSDSCQRGWRLFSIVAAYFACSDQLRPYLFKYLEVAAYDKRRGYHGTALVCLQNLRKTFRFGGRKNVPSIEEITAITAGRNSKRQIYRLPGGTERVINTKSTSVVQDIIEEICGAVRIAGGDEMDEFSLYCIVEGDTFTMPLAREEYILDVTTELQKNQQIFYLIFCRSVWYFPLRLDSDLYVEVVFNQITPDYLEGLLLVMPGETLQEQVVYDISRVAALLHRAADMQQVPTMKETKYLLPKAALMVRDIKPPQWVNMVQSNWQEVQDKTPMEAKSSVLEILESWPLFGSSFFAVSRVTESRETVEHILALNRGGVHFLDTVTHETLAKYPFSEVISTRKVKTEDGSLFLDMKYGNLMLQKVVRIQSDNAHEISRLIRQYISIEQKRRPTDPAVESGRDGQASR